VGAVVNQETVGKIVVVAFNLYVIDLFGYPYLRLNA